MPRSNQAVQLLSQASPRLGFDRLLFDQMRELLGWHDGGFELAVVNERRSLRRPAA